MTDRIQIQEIKEKLNIIDVVREYVPTLKKTGRNHFGLCPFHNEKTPSFSVNEELQIYKCFGCGESGDVISFIEKVEGLDFPKALEISAKRAGVVLNQKFSENASKEQKEKTELYEINRLVAEFYHYILMKHPSGKVGRDYANLRRLGKQQIEEFLIGFAPSGYDNLKKYLIKKGFDQAKLVKWSLLVSKNNQTYDKFRNRLMFPIFNHVGDIIAFSGRVVEKEDIPKYLNSSETLVYQKSKVLYGLYQGKEEIRKNKFSIIVEGNVDVPMAHKFGVKNIVAPMGTALTEDQLKLLKRYCDSVYFSFDSDMAGEKALVRSLDLAERVDLDSKAINLGEFGDLDDLIKADSSKLQSVVDSAEPVVENLIRRLLKRLNTGTAKGKVEFVNSIVPILDKLSDEVEKTHYVQQISNIVSVEESVIWEKLNKKEPKDTKEFKEPRKEMIVEPRIIDTKLLGTRKERYVLSFLSQYEFLRTKEIDWSIFNDKRLVELYNQLINTSPIGAIIDSLESDTKATAEEILMEDLGEFVGNHEVERFFDENYTELLEQSLRQKVKNLKMEIKKQEAEGLDTSEMLSELNALASRLKR